LGENFVSRGCAHKQGGGFWSVKIFFERLLAQNRFALTLPAATTILSAMRKIQCNINNVRGAPSRCATICVGAGRAKEVEEIGRVSVGEDGVFSRTIALRSNDAVLIELAPV